MIVQTIKEVLQVLIQSTGTSLRSLAEKKFLEYTNQSLETLKQLPKDHLFELQKAYYKVMLEKGTEFLFTELNYSPRDRDETVTYES